MKISYAPRALRDIDEILAYIRERSVQGARSVSFSIEYKIHLCAFNPYAGSKTDEPNVYRRALGKYRYAIFYRILPNEKSIEIARVIHGSRIGDLRKMPE